MLTGMPSALFVVAVPQRSSPGPVQRLPGESTKADMLLLLTLLLTLLLALEGQCNRKGILTLLLGPVVVVVLEKKQSSPWKKFYSTPKQH